MGSDRAEILRLAEELLEEGWDDVQLRTDDWELVLRRRHSPGAAPGTPPAPRGADLPGRSGTPWSAGVRVGHPAPVDAPAPSTSTIEAPIPAGTAGTASASGTVIAAPMPGTFYRAPRPGAPPFVEEGASVRPGQTVAIIEVMKLMFEVKAEASGTVEEVCVDDGTLVVKGDPLFVTATGDEGPPSG